MRLIEVGKSFRTIVSSDLVWMFAALIIVCVIIFGGVVVGEVYTLQTTLPGTFVGPMGVGVDASDNVYVADTGQNRILKFNSWGTFQFGWGTTSPEGVAPPPVGTFNLPYGVAADAAGNVYVSDYWNDRIQKFNSWGTFQLEWGTTSAAGVEPPPAGTFFGPFGIAVDTAGSVYVADSGNDRIQKFNSSGEYSLQWGTPSDYPPLPGTFIGPYGIAVDTSGNVYVSDYLNDRIQKFTPDGVYVGQWGTTSPAGVFPPPDGTFFGPVGLAVDAADNVYVADAGNDRIQKFDSSGNHLWTETAGGSLIGPMGVAVDSDGNLYVTDSDSLYQGRVQKFTQSEVITVKPGVTNGIIDCPVMQASYGSSPHCTITPINEGYYISDLQVGPNVDTLTSVTVASSYTFDNITADKAIYAVFTTKPIKLVLDLSTYSFYGNLSDAYAAASQANGYTMKIQDLPSPLTGNLTIAKPLIMEGGYDYDVLAFSSRAAGAVSVISGSIEITTGSLIADRIVIQ